MAMMAMCGGMPPVGTDMFTIDDPMEASYGTAGAVSKPLSPSTGKPLVRTESFKMRAQSFQMRSSVANAFALPKPGSALPPLRSQTSDTTMAASRVGEQGAPASRRRQSEVVMDLVAADADQAAVVSAASQMSAAERRQSILQMSATLAALMAAEEGHATAASDIAVVEEESADMIVPIQQRPSKIVRAVSTRSKAVHESMQKGARSVTQSKMADRQATKIARENNNGEDELNADLEKLHSSVAATDTTDC